MKKMAFGLISAAAMFLLAPSIAQAKIGVGVDAAFVLPVGDWSDSTGIGLGGLAKGSYGLSDNFDLTLRLGYIFHLGKDVNTGLGTVTVKSSEIPILVGAKYNFGAPYVAAEVGLTNYTASVGDISASEMKFSLTAGAGVMFSSLDLRAQVYFPSVGDIDKIIGIMITAGYTFVSF